MTKMIDLSETLISDLHKDARGYRPRDLPQFMEESEYNALRDSLIVELEESMEFERESELRAQRAYESRIARYQEQFGVDRATAQRWDWQAEFGEQEQPDVGYWIFLNGMSYDLESMYRDELRGAGLTVFSSTLD